jgi:hypothetical protein
LHFLLLPWQLFSLATMELLLSSTTLFFTWPEVSLGTALIISFLSGLFFGFLYMLFPYASAKSSHYKLKREHRELEHELNSLRTASLDDLSQEAVDVGSVDANGEKIG